MTRYKGDKKYMDLCIVEQEKVLIVIGGPTASGKSHVAIELAKHYTIDIINADSRQVYTELNIGVNKPTKDELSTTPHHLMGHVSIHEEYNVGLFEKEATISIESLFSKSNKIIVAGGTGLYINAILNGIDIFPDVSADAKQKVIDIVNLQGLVGLQKEILLHDPTYAEEVDLNNPRRLARALEVIYTTGHSYSSFRTHSKKNNSYKILPILINKKREDLYQKINKRVDQMMDLGLKQEAEKFYAFKHLKALQTVGYTEWFQHFEGIMTENEAVEKIKQHTRNYAKRQMTWWRPLQWPEYENDQIPEIIRYIQSS